MMHRFGFALLCALFLLPGVSRAAEDSFRSNGVKIHYYIEGEGEPVVLIHGFSANAQLQWGMSGKLKELAKDHRVIALDIRGHGESDKPTDVKKYGPEMVEDVVRLLDHLKIKKAHLIGYSMGSFIAGNLVANHPDRVLSATLGGSAVILAGEKLPDYVDEVADSLEKGNGLGPLLVGLTAKGKSPPSEAVVSAINVALVGDKGKALSAVVRSWRMLGVTKEKLKANKVPTLAVIGSIDPLKENVDAVKKCMGNLEVVVIDDGDHVTAFTSPEFMRSVRQFLDKHRQKKTAPAASAK